ncbi:MAG: penicillin-binding transpeptidase domain-containing protein [Rikenellaceae bacterium]|nr:penicillin-binding transpeptidase domain-containing protein [Rikenellaceae bacterium]
MAQEDSPIKSDILLRVRLLYIFFIVLVAVVLVRLVYVQFFARETRINAERLSTRIFLPDTIYARRGNILARDGEPLATSLFRYQPKFDFASEGFADEETYLTQSDSLAKLLSAYFGDRSVEGYRRLLRAKRDSARRYKLGKEYDTTYYREDEGLLLLLIDLMTGRAKVTERVRDTLRNHRPTVLFPRDVDYGEWEVLRRYPILNYNMGVTYFLSEYDQRIYPQGDLARRLIGRTGTAGNYGLEMLYAEELEGVDGFSIRQRIARGFSTRVAEAEHRDAIDGLDVVTTLDLNLQDVADKALREQLERQNATWGTTLVMETATGEILAMANVGRSADGKLTERENYALSRSMEPGSTFKLATILTLLDEAKMSPDREYETRDGNPVKVGPADNIRDSHRGDHTIALKRAVAGSSNVYFAKAVWEYYGATGQKQRFSNHLNEVLGLGERVLADTLLGERKPSITREWRVPDPGIMLVKMSYGYRVQMTPIQMLTFYNAIANGGKKIAPILVRELRRGDEVVERFKTRTLREEICSKETLHIVRDCLEEVAKTGTAAPFFSDTTRFSVGAKTGTAQITSGEKGHYLGSMVAYFPADKPRYTVLTTIRTKQQAGKAYYGAGLAGPVVKRVVEYIYGREQDWASTLETEDRYAPERLKGGSIGQLREVADELSPRLSFDKRQGWGRAEIDSLAHVTLVSQPAERGVMPNVKGMGLKDALFLLEYAGLRVQIEGSGAVHAQSIAPGEKVQGGTPVLIRLK